MEKRNKLLKTSLLALTCGFVGMGLTAEKGQGFSVKTLPEISLDAKIRNLHCKGEPGMNPMSSAKIHCTGEVGVIGTQSQTGMGGLVTRWLRFNARETIEKCKINGHGMNIELDCSNYTCELRDYGHARRGILGLVCKR